METIISASVGTPLEATVVPPARHKTTHVLIVAHSDGYLEAFHEDGAQVHLYSMPESCGVNGEILAEQYLEASLPRFLRSIFWPGLCHTLGRPLSGKPSDIAARQAGVDLLHELEQLRISK